MKSKQTMQDNVKEFINVVKRELIDCNVLNDYRQHLFNLSKRFKINIYFYNGSNTINTLGGNLNVFINKNQPIVTIKSKLITLLNKYLLDNK